MEAGLQQLPGMDPEDVVTLARLGARLGGEAAAPGCHVFITQAVRLAAARSSSVGGGSTPGTDSAEGHVRHGRTQPGADAGAAGTTTVAAAAPEPLRLRHWNALLRAAERAGWEDAVTAGQALDAMLAELSGFKSTWIATLQGRRRQALGHLQQQQLRSGPDPVHGGGGAGDDDGTVERFDPTASQVAGMVVTAARLRLGRPDVIAAAISALLQARGRQTVLGHACAMPYCIAMSHTCIT